MADATQKGAETNPTSGLAIVVALAIVKMVLHVVFNRDYGYFRDELYYLACAEHLDWGYVDQPPLVALYAWVGSALGGSLAALRFLPALAGAVKVLLAGLITRELGGGRFAQALAALATLAATIYLVLDNFLSMNAFEPVFWMGCVYLLLRILNTGNSKLWVGFGVLAGLGLMNKHSTAFFGLGIVAGLLLTPARRYLRDKWLWLGGVVALLIFLPNLVWQMQHDWATYELLSNVKASSKNVVLDPLSFFAQQILVMNPLTFPIWLAGLAWLLFARAGRPYRVLGWAYVVMFVAFVALKGKIYYLAPAYPMLLAAGSVFLENATRPKGRAWVRAAAVVVVLASGAALAPIGLPVLAPQRFLNYMAALRIPLPRTETSHTAALPQHYADQFGWEELAAEVAHIYHSLPPDERAKTAIFGGNYGEAGAIDFFGSRYGLPKAISGHQSYFLWGPRGYTGEIVIVLGGSRQDLERRFEQVEEAAAHFHPWGMPFENRPIYLCRRLKTPLGELWPQVKRWL